MVDLKVKEWFFDREKVLDRIGAARVRALSKAGAFIRTRARSLLRRRKKASAPGSPPSVHAPSGSFASLKTVLFFYDPSTESVVVGPVKLNQTDRFNGAIAAGTVPQLHEFGGVRGVKEIRWPGSFWYRADGRSRRIRPGQEQRLRSATYPARPFMGPALRDVVAQGKVANVWASAVKDS